MQTFKIMYSAETIAERIHELADEIVSDFGGEEIYMIALANGAVPFAADLMRAMNCSVLLNVIRTSRYRNGSIGDTLNIYAEDLLKPEGRNVLLVDDILDTGKTISAIREKLLQKKTAVLKTCVLLDKPARREVEIEPDYKGFTAENYFVFGFGLDDENGKYRNLPYIAYK